MSFFGTDKNEKLARVHYELVFNMNNKEYVDSLNPHRQIILFGLMKNSGVPKDCYCCPAYFYDHKNQREGCTLMDKPFFDMVCNKTCIEH